MSKPDSTTPVATAEPNTPATSGNSPRLMALPVDKLFANDYNPNRMTAEAFAELAVEIRHLGRLPKPVVVRPNGSGYLIVDGDHGWRAAQEVGLAEVPCEVIEVDDVEAMRQTYKRNRHGNDDALRLGRMFKRMMDTRGLSQRSLAKEIEISEGTIRNGLIYSDAADARNSYPHGEMVKENAETPDEQIARLSVRQVRAYLQLPPTIANLWLDAGADLRELYRAKSGDEVDELEAHHPQSLASCLKEYADLEQTGRRPTHLSIVLVGGSNGKADALIPRGRGPHVRDVDHRSHCLGHVASFEV